MGRDIARLHLPVESAVGQKVKQFATRHIVLRVHQVEVAVYRVYDDAIGHSYLTDFGSIRQTGTDNLVGPDVDDAVGDGVGHRHFAPL